VGHRGWWGVRLFELGCWDVRGLRAAPIEGYKFGLTAPPDPALYLPTTQRTPIGSRAQGSGWRPTAR
jgi:hypothetical protein